MKVKYLRLNKKERKEAKEKYYQTPTGKYVKKKLLSALICSLLCIALAIYNIIDAYVRNLSTLDKVYAYVILLIGFSLLFVHRKIFVKKINEYVIKNK